MPDHEANDTLPAMSRPRRAMSQPCRDWLVAAQIRNAREYVDLDALENAFWLDGSAMVGAP